MIPAGVDVYVACSPIDLRWSFERLCGIIAEHLQRDARNRALYVFFGKRRSALKVIFFDGTGLCIFYKRLDRGTFRMPMLIDPHAPDFRIEERELHDLLAGIEIHCTAPRKRHLH